MKKAFEIVLFFVVAFMLGGISRPHCLRFAHRVCAKVQRTLGYGCPANHRAKARMISYDDSLSLKGAIRISFVGDLILLRDAVEYGHERVTKQHKYDDVFEKIKPYWKNDDLTLAVFEGPMAGDKRPYTTSDYDDGIPLYLNFPDEFGTAVKNAGVDYVTLANNHLLDQGIDGVMRTLSRLDAIGLNHGGAFRNGDEKGAIKVLSVRGRKLAVLEYTYGSNYYPDDYFFNKKTSYITRPIVGIESRFLDENVQQVRDDLAKARGLNADAIIVMPHMGEQFLHAPDKTQQFWCDEFVKGGADIILSDHPHAVQPIEWKKGADQKDVVIVHCPGNFVNSYAPHDGDASYMAEIYLDPDSAKPVASSFVPLYGYGAPNGNFAGIPVYDAVLDREFMASLSRNDFRRLQDVQRTITSVVLDEKIELVNAAKRYYLFPSGDHFYERPPAMDMTDVPKDSVLLNAIVQARSICFVGDSITEGTKNHGVGWYVPLMENYNDKVVTSFAKGSMTSKWFREHSCKIADQDADLYVMAFGCNDIRYRDPQVCAMTADAYVDNCKELVRAIRAKNAIAQIIFISPWESANNDMICTVSIAEKESLYQGYARKLSALCQEMNCAYIGPNRYIWLKVGKNTIGGGGDIWLIISILDRHWVAHSIRRHACGRNKSRAFQQVCKYERHCGNGGRIDTLLFNRG